MSKINKNWRTFKLLRNTYVSSPANIPRIIVPGTNINKPNASRKKDQPPKQSTFSSFSIAIVLYNHNTILAITMYSFVSQRPLMPGIPVVLNFVLLNRSETITNKTTTKSTI